LNLGHDCYCMRPNIIEKGLGLVNLYSRAKALKSTVFNKSCCMPI